MPDPDLPAELGRRLRARGYDERELARVLGVPPDRAIDPDYLPLAVRRAAAEGGTLATLAPLTPERLAQAGVVSAAGDGVRANLRVLPYEGLLLAFDPPDGEAGADEVTAPGPSARTLAAVTVRRRVRTALDLGSGGGVQGLLLARHSEHVVLSDVSPRARDFAALNAGLNGMTNVELRTGDWFDPVAGERFDLVVANLPYVVSPDVEYVHRDNPLARDELSRTVVERVADHLNEGGYAHVLCSWVHGAEEPWADRPLAWLPDAGCDALVLHYSSHEPLEYAASWNRPLQRTDPAAFEATLDRWLGYYAEAGIKRIASGAIILRRRGAGGRGGGGGGRTWSRPVEVPDAPTGLAGAHVERMFSAQDELARLAGPEALLEERLTPAPGQRLDQAMLYRDGSFVPDAALMRREPGIGVVARVDPRVMPVVVGCDGRRPLGELIERATQRLGRRERVELATLCFATVRTAFELGLLERANGPS